MTLDTLFLIWLVTSIAANISIVVVISFLAIRKIVDWFPSRSAINLADKDNIAFTLQSKLDSGNYKTVQGIFNTRNNDIKEGRVIEFSKDIDSQMKKLHDNDELVIYE